MFRKNSILAVSAAALAITFGAAVAAQPQDHDGRHGRFEQQLAQLHGQLKLNADQEKLWQSALDTMKQNRAAQRAAHRQMKQQFEAAGQQPILDLNAMNSAQQNAAQQREQLHQQTAAAWLNFYNALDNQQKTIVSTALKTRWARMAKMRAKWQARHAHMDHHHGAASASAAQQ